MTYLSSADAPDAGISSNVSRAFIAKLTSVEPGVLDNSLWVYSWIEQSFNTSTGAYEDAQSGRFGDVIHGPFAVEINNHLVIGLPVYANLQLRGIVNGQPYYEFQSPDFGDTYTALVVTEIPASFGEPTFGTVLVYGYNPVTGEMNDTSEFSLEVFSLWDVPIEVCAWVHLGLEPISGKFFVYSIPGTSGCGNVPTGSGNTQYYCLASPTSCDFDCYGTTTGEEDNILITGNTLNGNGESAAIFNPGHTGTQTTTLDYTITSLPIGEGNIGFITMAIRSDCPSTCYFDCQCQFAVTGVDGSQTNILDISEVGGAGSYVQTSLPNISTPVNLQMKIVDNGTSIVLSCYDTSGPTLLGSVTLTSSVTCGTYMVMTVDLAPPESGPTPGYATHLNIMDSSGVTWDDTFHDADGTKLINHTANVGCGGSSGSGGSGGVTVPCCGDVSIPTTLTMTPVSILTGCECLDGKTVTLVWNGTAWEGDLTLTSCTGTGGDTFIPGSCTTTWQLRCIDGDFILCVIDGGCTTANILSCSPFHLYVACCVSCAGCGGWVNCCSGGCSWNITG